MKKVILLFFLPFGFSGGGITPNFNKQVTPVDSSYITPPVILPPQPVDELVNALIHVESRGIDSAVGDTHLQSPSIGVLQIRPVMVREVNRILKRTKSDKRYKLKDRFSREKSIEMFMIWKNYHHPKDGFEEIARCWNGGPRGMKNKRTEKYWIKVQKHLNGNY